MSGHISCSFGHRTVPSSTKTLLKYCKDNGCYCGETLQQSDSCLIDAPDVLSDIIDNILQIKTTWKDEK